MVRPLHDVVFTVEYSIRTAHTVAYALLGLSRRPPPVYKGQRHAGRSIDKSDICLSCGMISLQIEMEPEKGVGEVAQSSIISPQAPGHGLT